MRASIIPAGNTKQLALSLVGPGTIGKALMAQLKDRDQFLRDRLGIELRLVGVTSSSKMLLSSPSSCLALEDWQRQFDTSATPADMDSFSAHIEGMPSDGVVVDCTAADAPCDYYARWMGAGLHVVTPNKKLHSGPLARYQGVRALQAEGRAHYLYEGTCGAGLPVLTTLKGLLEAGDEVIEVEGILSGTLSYVFNTWRAGQPFSEVVLQAKAMGYTEPDPREDLSGTDVARKVIILARECGATPELAELAVDSLVPAALRDVSVEQFCASLPEHDAHMAATLADAQAEGCVLRYVGKYEAASNRCSITLARYPAEHPFAQLSGTDNIVSIRTRRYDSQPLIVRGPGAGPEVTAGGVFADLLHLMRYLGARG